jgi:uncharacterized membrane protein
MKADRLNAFTDGVLAIAITIMVLELHVPGGRDLDSLLPVLSLLGAYALSFVNIGIFWTNHHHMMQAARRVDGATLWANLLLLFWLSLVPFVIRWIGEVGISPAPVAAYGFVLAMAAISYVILERALVAADPDSPVKAATGGKGKEIASMLLYVAGIGLAMVSPWLSVAAYVTVAALWLVPDRRFERVEEGRK